MAKAEAEQADLARMPGGLLINFGTVDSLDGMLAAGLPRESEQQAGGVRSCRCRRHGVAFRRATAASERLCVECRME